MAGFRIPKRAAESLKSESQPFPAGPWIGEFEDVEVRSLPDWSEWKKPESSGYESTDGEELSIQIGRNRFAGNVPSGEEAPTVGEKKKFFNLVLRDGNRTVEDVDVDARSVSYFKLQKSARMLANLAIALGWTDEAGDSIEVRDGFVDALRSGAFKGDRVGFTIYHRGYNTTNPDGSKGRGIAEEIEGFFAAE